MDAKRKLWLIPITADTTDEEIERMAEQLGQALGLPGAREESEPEQEKE
jgi:hypothetical protein